jgi:homoserine kinase type II
VANPRGDARLSDVYELLNTFYSHCLDTASLLIHPPDNSAGFSGAEVRRVQHGPASFCLRRWPTADRHEGTRLRWIHRQLFLAHEAGCHFLPVPIATRGTEAGAGGRESLVWFDGDWWQLEPWMPGRADLAFKSDDARLREAISGLARLHRALDGGAAQSGLPSALLHRQRELERWFAAEPGGSPFQQLARVAIHDPVVGNVATAICDGAANLAPRILDDVGRIIQKAFRLQVVAGDVRPDHMLFESDRLTGIVDFGAMKVDHVALDIARLAGSLPWWGLPSAEIALKQYRETASLDSDEIELANIYDSSGAVLAGLNWLKWRCQEHRQMGPDDAVQKRLGEIASRISRAQATPLFPLD